MDFSHSDFPQYKAKDSQLHSLSCNYLQINGWLCSIKSVGKLFDSANKLNFPSNHIAYVVLSTVDCCSLLPSVLRDRTKYSYMGE